jgi:hypothetical protein
MNLPYRFFPHARAFLNDWRITMASLYDPGHSMTAGMTGAGKTYLFVDYFRQSFRRNIPIFLIDPKGDTVQAVETYLFFHPEGRKFYEKYKHKIIIVNPVSVSDQIVGWNGLSIPEDFPLVKVDSIALTADTVTTQLRKQSMFGEGEAMRMQTLLWASIGALIDGGEGRYTMREFSYVFKPTWNEKGKLELYNPFLKSLLERTQHDGVLDFWYNRWPGISSQDRMEWFQAAYNRVYQYYFDERVALTTCTIDNARLDFQKIADEGYWVLMNIPYKHLSEEKASLIGNFAILQYFYACLRRGQDAPKRYLFLEEAQFFTLAPLDRIMNLARSSNMFLHIIVQNIDQMLRSREGRVDEGLKKAIKGCVRYWNIFHNTEDANELADLMFSPAGEEQRGLRQSGDVDYYTPQGEENLYARLFKQLPKRQVILWDNLSGTRPFRWKTSTINLPKVPEEQVAMEEGKHLASPLVGGVPAKFIRDEREERKRKVEAMFQTATPTANSQQTRSTPTARPSDLRRPQ